MVNLTVSKNISTVNLYIPLIIVNEKGIIVESNNKACDFLGLKKIPEDLLLDSRKSLYFFISFIKVLIDRRESNQIYFSPSFLREKSPKKFKDLYFIFSYLKDNLCIAEIKRINLNNEIERGYIHRISNEKALNKSLSVLMNLNTENVKKAFKYIRETSDASIVYIVKNFIEDKTGDLCAKYSEEVCGKGITSVHNKQRGKCFKYKNGLLNIQRRLSKGEIITGYLDNFSLVESEFMSPENTGYIIIAPIFIDNKWFGFVGMTFCCKIKDISVLDIKALSTLSDQLSVYYFLSIKRKIIRDANYELSDDLMLKDKMTSLMGKDVKKRLREIVKLSNSLIINVQNNSQETIIRNSYLINSSAKTVNSVVEYISELIEYLYSNKDYELKQVSARRIIGESISFYKELASQKFILLNDKSEKDFLLYTDGNLILSVFKSVLINAIKYSSKGSEITLLCKRDPKIKNNIIICIKNFGIGLSEEVLNKLYKPVVKISNNIDRFETIRLGMQVSKKLIKLVHGYISVESKEGVGTSVFISVPEYSVSEKTMNINILRHENYAKLPKHNLNTDEKNNNVVDNTSFRELIDIKNSDVPLLIVNREGLIIDKNEKACEILELEDIPDNFLIKQNETSKITISVLKSVVEDKALNRIFLLRSLGSKSFKNIENLYFLSSFLEKNFCIVEIKKIDTNNVLEIECFNRIKYEDALNLSSLILSEKKKESPSRAMKYILEVFKASNIYLFKNFIDRNGNLIAKCKEKFCSKRSSKKKDNCTLKFIDYKKEVLLKIQAQLSKGQIFSGYINEFFKVENNYTSSLEKGYFLVAPIFVDSKWFGFIAMDFNNKNINITALDIQSIQSVSEQFAVYYSFLKFDKALLYTKDRLIKNMEFKNKMTSLMRHDIKNPLSGIIGFSDLLINEIHNFSKKEIMEYSTLINKTAKSLDKIVDNISEWVRSLNPNVKIDIQPISVKKIVERSISLVDVMASFKSVSLLNKVNCNKIVNTDADMIFTVMRNIIINAIKFTPEKGTVTISCENDFRNKGNIIICIEDTGIGMSQERIKQILKKDEIISKEGTNGEKGLGLGLQFSKRFIKLIKGEMRIESTSNKGTKFLISLPEYK